MNSHRLRAAVAAGLSTSALIAASCGGTDDDRAGASDGTRAASGASGHVSVIGGWTGDEQKSFQAVLDGFEEKHPDVTVEYSAAGDNVPTVLGTAVEGGNPPNIAMIAQPGLVEEFVGRGTVKPLEFAKEAIAASFPADLIELGTVDGKLYSFLFKAANKSTVWFNTQAFEEAGVEPPTTWDELLTRARTLKASGVPAYSIAGADGWTLTDLFENVYLRQAGPEKYDQLANHEIKWTDRSVKDALETMAQVLGDSGNIAGGGSGALQTDFPTSVSNVFSSSPAAAMVIEGDFVPGVVASKTSVEPGTDYDVFAFPEIGDTTDAVVGGGDSVVMFDDTPAARALVEYLATPEAAEIWASRGGFASANTEVSPEAYADELTMRTATSIAEAETFRFDMSDLAPAEFGGTPGQGEWKILQDFLADPSKVDEIAAKLEAAAAKAYAR
jgi:alpha-glucoside transport system substrate-binding protein